MAMIRSIVGVAIAIASCTVAVRAADPTTLAQVHFLLGTWEGAGGGKPGEGSGGTTFASMLQGSVILRTNFAEYPAAAGRPASRHDDLMVIYVEGTEIKADYYDNEGHVVRYAVRSPASHEAVFLRDAAAPGPRFRLSYKLAPDGSLEGRFEIAPPGKPEAFGPYLAWTMKRKEKE